MLYFKKETGETMDQLIQRIKLVHPAKKLAYTTRLDPMAKGIVQIITDDMCVDIKKYLSMEKTYEVKIIMGIQTDTDDVLGLIQNKQIVDIITYLKIKKLIIDYLNLINKTSFLQKFHYYSTKMMNHRRRKTVDIIDTHLVSIFEYEILCEKIINYKKWCDKIISKIKLIDNTKNYRQNIIIKQWEDTDFNDLFAIKLRIKVSSGFFIRQLIRDISNIINFPIMCYNINRINIH